MKIISLKGVIVKAVAPIFSPLPKYIAALSCFKLLVHCLWFYHVTDGGLTRFTQKVKPTKPSILKIKSGVPIIFWLVCSFIVTSYRSSHSELLDIEYGSFFEEEGGQVGK